MSDGYELVPVTLRQANAMIGAHHGHNEAVRGWRFGVGLSRDGELVAVAVAGRPTGRGFDGYRDIEITRVCINEKGAHPNAGSRLYGALCRASASLGYRDVYTYTLAEEDAASVRAAGFVLDAELSPRVSWNTPSRPEQDQTLFGPRKRPTGPKKRWVRHLASHPPNSRERLSVSSYAAAVHALAISKKCLDKYIEDKNKLSALQSAPKREATSPTSETGR